MVKGIGHTAIRARDIEASASFYQRMLGMQEAFRLDGPDGGVGCIYLYAGPGQFIELFPGGKREAARGGDAMGFVHLCFVVDDAAAEFQRMRALGAPIDRELKVGQSACIQFWTHDPDGNSIELMELPPESLQAQADRRLSGADNR